MYIHRFIFILVELQLETNFFEYTLATYVYTGNLLMYIRT